MSGTSRIAANDYQSQDMFVYEHYPVIWQGALALKNDQAAVQMHYVSGNPGVARAALPPVTADVSVSISQRMRLEQHQLDSVYRKMQVLDEHCILLALPYGTDNTSVIQQSNHMRTGFINYLQRKHAAGIVNASASGSQQPSFVIHFFPSCEFAEASLARIAPDLLNIIYDITYLVIIISTV